MDPLKAQHFICRSHGSRLPICLSLDNRSPLHTHFLRGGERARSHCGEPFPFRLPGLDVNTQGRMPSLVWQAVQPGRGGAWSRAAGTGGCHAMSLVRRPAPPPRPVGGKLVALRELQGPTTRGLLCRPMPLCGTVQGSPSWAPCSPPPRGRGPQLPARELHLC